MRIPLRVRGEKQKEPKVQTNPELIRKIQPHFGIAFTDEKYIKLGDGYEACIYIYGFKRYIREFWLSNIMNINSAVVVLDISTQQKGTIRRTIDKSVAEQNDRYANARSVTERMDAEQQISEMTTIYDEIFSHHEEVKLVSCRIYVPARSLSDCDERVKNIINYLEGEAEYKAGVCLGETKADWKAMLMPLRKQQMDSLHKRSEQPILSSTLALGNPFHFVSLKDPYGTYFGSTAGSGGGPVLFDMFHQDKVRMSYNGLLLGVMGSGKSTTLKKLMEDRAVRGDFVRVFDPTGEFASLGRHLGARIISLDGSSGEKINPLEIFQTADQMTVSYSQHLSKVSTIYRYLNPEAGQYDITNFEMLLKGLYKEWDLLPENGRITGLAPENYPTFSDLVRHTEAVIGELESDEYFVKEKERIVRLKNIRDTLKNIVDNYGAIFEGHTAIPNLDDEQIVIFDISELISYKEEVADAQIFSALSLCWDNAVKIGSAMKKAYDQDEINWEEITRFLIIIDEAHRIVNANKLVGINEITLLAREGRKYFTGILLASQSIRDYLPENAEGAGTEKIKTFFELCTYKFIMRQDANCVGLLADAFRNQLSDSELSKIPLLEKGQTVLAISGDRNINFRIHLTEQEGRLFTGGA